jgi:hypothetical protein
MNSIAFSVNSLTEDQALQIATAFVKGGRDPVQMARILGVDRLDMNLVMHPLVRGHVVRMQRVASSVVTMEEHLQKLADIRDAAFTDENWKVALAAETQRGKAAGLYEPKLPGDDDDPALGKLDPTKMSTQELRRRLAQTIGAVIPQGEAIKALPEPGSLEGQELVDDDNNEI